MNHITDPLKKGAVQAAAWLPDALMISGAGAIAYGCGLAYLPAGYVVGGLLALAGGWIVARGAT
ncbi:MAG: hypothetical protein ABJA84_01905 [Polaromonas sp.]